MLKLQEYETVNGRLIEDGIKCKRDGHDPETTVPIEPNVYVNGIVFVDNVAVVVAGASPAGRILLLF